MMCRKTQRRLILPTLLRNQDLYKYIATDLTPSEEKLLIATLKEYKDTFAWNYKDLKGVDPIIY